MLGLGQVSLKALRMSVHALGANLYKRKLLTLPVLLLQRNMCVMQSCLKLTIFMLKQLAISMVSVVPCWHFVCFWCACPVSVCYKQGEAALLSSTFIFCGKQTKEGILSSQLADLTTPRRELHCSPGGPTGSHGPPAPSVSDVELLQGRNLPTHMQRQLSSGSTAAGTGIAPGAASHVITQRGGLDLGDLMLWHQAAITSQSNITGL